MSAMVCKLLVSILLCHGAMNIIVVVLCVGVHVCSVLPRLPVYIESWFISMCFGKLMHSIQVVMLCDVAL